MNFYKITAKSEDSTKQIIRTLKNSNAWARTNGNPLEIYSATSEGHNNHVPDIAKRFNADVEPINRDQIPEEIKRLHGGIPKREYLAFDGKVFTDKNLFSSYERNNNPKYTTTRNERWKVKRERKPRASKVETIYRIEPNQNFDLAGVINSLQILEDKLLKAYTEVSEVRKNLANVADIQKLLQDKQDYLNSAKHILNQIS